MILVNKSYMYDLFNQILFNFYFHDILFLDNFKYDIFYNKLHESISTVEEILKSVE